jgi:lysophospholipid acyltransferase 5
VFEFATSTEQVIASFNMNTNLWVKVYIFKRLKFLNNKSLSQVVSLAFLAIWHGFHVNYFVTFITEFLVVEAEGVLRKRLRPSIMRHTQNNPILDTAWKVLAWIICTSTVNYAVVGFDLLLFRKAWIAYSTIGFIGHIAIASVLFGGKFPKSPQIFQSAKKTE